jgi:Rieske 2Fe-2S family protein
LIANRLPGHALPRELYVGAEAYAADLEHIFHREWIFVGHDCEIASPGDYITAQIGLYPLIIIRGDDRSIRALHNSCRHRGARLCDGAQGHAHRRIVCPYHQWSYGLDGRLARARDLTGKLDPVEYGLRQAHVTSVGGMLFASVAREAPDVAPLRETIEPYLAPFDLRSAKVAFESRIVETGNWKLVLENNRECYHCSGSHPELCRSFPETSAHANGDDADLNAFVAAIEARGLPGRYQLGPEGQFRVMRMQLQDGARSMTMTGKPAVGRTWGALPADTDIGDVLLYHYPSTWNHFMADHAVTFRALPLAPDRTELVTRWLVPGEAVAGVDYDLTTLTEVWLATNAQDGALVERNFAGVSSPAYEPGPYSPEHESGVIQFVDWYAATMLRRLAGAPRLVSVA